MQPFAPNFETRKQVEAHPIISVGPRAVLVSLPDGSERVVDTPLGFSARSMPAAGDMLVRYADGYLSHCPRETFLRDAHPVTPLPRTELPAPDAPRVPRREHATGADPRLPPGRHHP